MRNKSPTSLLHRRRKEGTGKGELGMENRRVFENDKRKRRPSLLYLLPVLPLRQSSNPSSVSPLTVPLPTPRKRFRLKQVPILRAIQWVNASGRPDADAWLRGGSRGGGRGRVHPCGRIGVAVRVTTSVCRGRVGGGVARESVDHSRGGGGGVVERRGMGVGGTGKTDGDVVVRLSCDREGRNGRAESLCADEGRLLLLLLLELLLLVLVDG